MKILLTGANGYIGMRLWPALLHAGHDVVAVVRDRRRFPEVQESFAGKLSLLEADLLDREALPKFPEEIDAAYYLVHSLGSGDLCFDRLEERAAENFSQALASTGARQIIYLSGISNEEELSPHLRSRRHVEEVLRRSGIALSVLRAAIIIGSGSASFEIIRDLVEKLPVMVTPRWVKTRCQPIAIRNVIEYLVGVLGKEGALDQVFDIGGPDVLTYREMMLGYAEVRKLRRWLIAVPVLTPRLSSYWLYFVTSTNYALARNLVESMRHEVICRDERIREIVPLDLIGYREAIALAFSKISQRQVASSWVDSLSSSDFHGERLQRVEVPEHGCFRDAREFAIEGSAEEVIAKIWQLGGERGWLSMNWAWRIRGFLDKLVGGAGLRRGRRHPTELKVGDALDFWRVLDADRERGRLILYAEMKLPGEAWLEFDVDGAAKTLRQVATFRPSGLWGRLYWYAVMPFHHWIFARMGRSLGEK